MVDVSNLLEKIADLITIMIRVAELIAEYFYCLWVQFVKKILNSTICELDLQLVYIYSYYLACKK